MKETKIFSKNNTFQKFEVLKTNRNKRYKYNLISQNNYTQVEAESGSNH